MSVYQPESFYETTLASAITATQTTIPVTIAPNITSGYLVIEGKTSNREIILYTGVSGTTLTGVTRGLAEYGSDNSGGSGTAHAAGVEIANKDVHYYYAQYYDFLVGTSATGYNTMRIGDGNTISASNRLWYVQTSSLSAFWGMSASGQMVVSEDGVTSYVISAGGSGIAAGDGIDITGGVASVDILSTGGLRISAAQLQVYYDGDALKATSASELYFDKSVSNNWSGVNTYQTSTVFQSSGSHLFSGQVNFDSNIPLVTETTPTSGAHLVRKTYVDDRTILQGYEHTQQTVSMVTSGNTYTVHTEAVPAMGANDTLIIRGTLGSSSSAGTETLKVQIDDGTATDVLSVAQSSGYHDLYFEIIVVNRNSTSSQYYDVRIFNSNNAVVHQSGTLTKSLGSTFNIVLTCLNSAQSGLTGTMEYLDVQIIKA